MADAYDEMRSWAVGVVRSVRPDEIPKEAVQRAENAQVAFVGGGKAVYRKRFGLGLYNRDPLSEGGPGIGSPIVGQSAYPFVSAGTETPYQVRLTADGDLHVGTDGGSDTETFTAFTSTGLSGTTEIPDFAVANNRLFVLDGEGGRVGLKGLLQTTWGIGTVSGLALAATGVGSMSGAYDIVVTLYDSDILDEGDISDEVSISGLVNQQLQITVNSVPAVETNKWFRVYIRKPVLGSGFYRVLSGTGFNATHQAFALHSASPTVNTVINLSDAAITALILPAPEVNTHGLPPDNIRYCAWWRRRMFVATDNTLYWSQEDKPDAFDPLDQQPINDGRGGRITGLKTAFDTLQLFTQFSRWEVTGSDDPRTWIIEMVDPEMGMEGHRSFVFINGWAYWWNRQHGPIRWDGDGAPQRIGSELLEAEVRPPSVNLSNLRLTATAAVNDRVLFGYPEQGKDRITRFVSWSTKINGFESEKWDPMDAASIATMQDLNGEPNIYLGNYNGQIFRMLDGGNDGVRTGTHTGTFISDGTPLSVLADLTATFDAVGANNGGLIERKITILDSDGKHVTGERPHITTNTATELTLSSSIGGLLNGQTYTYLIGGPDFIWEPYWGDHDLPFVEKRYDQGFLQFIADDGVSVLRVDIAYGFDVIRNTQATSFDTSTTVWDEAFWDVSFWDDIPTLTRKTRLGKIGLNYRIQLSNPYPDQGFTILKTAVLARKLTSRNLANI